jgi:four helix bundle protein
LPISGEEAMIIKRFEDIKAWKESRKLVNMVYCLTDNGNFKRDFSLKQQIQSASVSCMSNVAEGFDSESNQQFIQFLVYTRRSSSEVQSQLYVALDRKYVTKEEFEQAYEQAKIVGKLSNGFMKYLKTNNRQLATGKQVN